MRGGRHAHILIYTVDGVARQTGRHVRKHQAVTKGSARLITRGWAGASWHSCGDDAGLSVDKLQLLSCYTDNISFVIYKGLKRCLYIFILPHKKPCPKHYSEGYPLRNRKGIKEGNFTKRIL